MLNFFIIFLKEFSSLQGKQTFLFNLYIKLSEKMEHVFFVSIKQKITQMKNKLLDEL